MLELICMCECGEEIHGYVGGFIKIVGEGEKEGDCLWSMMCE